MSNKELTRYRVLGGVALGVSPRHARRLLQRLRESGPKGLVHGNRGRSLANRTSEPLRQQILAWVEERYAGFNDTHLAETLAEREGISIGRETLHSLLRDARHRPKRKRRPKRHHRRRERSAAKGLMILWDASPHRRLGDQQPPSTQMAAVDDADGESCNESF